jgi:hypothetical protein
MKKNTNTVESNSLKEAAILEIREYSDDEIVWSDEPPTENNTFVVHGKYCDFEEKTKYVVAYLKENPNVVSGNSVEDEKWSLERIASDYTIGGKIRISNKTIIIADIVPDTWNGNKVSYSENQKANASLIVESANNYTKLKEVAKEARDIIAELVQHLEWREDFIVEDAEENENEYSKAKAFLQKAKDIL